MTPAGTPSSISAGRSQFSIRPLGLDDYPVQAEPAAEAVTLSASAVAEALRQVVRAASTDDARAVLTGVLIAAEDDGVRMVATDSYRLAVRDLPESGPAGERPEGARPEPGAQRAAAGARAGPTSCRSGSARATPCSSRAGHASRRG